MFEIRGQQREAFDEASVVTFQKEMVAHSQAFSPRLCEVLGEEQVHAVVQQAMQRADRYELTNRGPVRLFMELTFLFGSDFDTDPQYPWVAESLAGPGDQMRRAEKLYEKTLDYQDHVAGADRSNTHKALSELSSLAENPLPFSSSDFVSGMIGEMSRVFPAKAEYVGESGLRALIDRGRAVAQDHRFPAVHGEALVVVLMFAFGHGCPDDLLYPWIARTLKDKEITSPEARASRLEKKALTWLRHVLAENPKGTET